MNQHESPTEPPWISRSVALYQRLLVLYPPAFRRAYGAQLVQTFRDQCRQAAQEHGLPGLLRYGMSMLTDLASNALAEHFQESLTMSRATLIRLAGGLTLGSVVVLLAMLLSTGTPLFTIGLVFSLLGPDNGRGFPAIGILYVSPGVTFPLVFKLLAACCLALGLLGITLAQRRWIGRLAGGLALLGQIGMVLYTFLVLWTASLSMPDYLGLVVTPMTGLLLWNVLLPFASSLLLGLGLIGCGWVTFKTGQFASWRRALLVLGLWLEVGNLGLSVLQWTNPALFAQGAGYARLVGVSSFSWMALFFTLFALISYGLWGWLGFTLWVQKPPREAQIQAALG